MKKMRTLTTMAAAAIVVVGIVPATPGNLGANFAMFFGDSPIDISDGSIHANVGFFNPWKPIVAGETYSGTTNNSDTITLQKFQSSSPSATGTDYTFRNTGGWFITITTEALNKDNRTLNPDAIALCSTNGFSSTCDPKNMTIDATQNLVLIETHPDNTHPHGHNGHWAESLLITKELTFQDTRPGCKQQNDLCEHVSAITIYTVNSSSGLPGSAGATFTPTDPKNFHIIVGQ